MKALSSLLLAVLALAACGGGGPVDQNASGHVPDSSTVGGSDVGTASADGSAPANVAAPGGRAPLTSGDTATAAEAALPAALHGRWGMNPSDCTAAPEAANGLLTVTPGELRFYESVAVPARNVKKSANSLSADFDFTGEGQSWTKFQTLELQEDKLVRTESSPMASFTYVRCR
jgi:predicted small lipoprotein YifL